MKKSNNNNTTGCEESWRWEGLMMTGVLVANSRNLAGLYLTN